MLGMITCKQASYLTSRKEEGKLSFKEKMKLGMHLGMCRICKLFSSQNQYIATHARNIEENTTQDIKLSQDEKEYIERKLK